jgi:hypothetical protein
MGIIDKLNKDFESRVRLGIMSVLMVNDWVDFTEMKALWWDPTNSRIACCLNVQPKHARRLLSPDGTATALAALANLQPRTHMRRLF